jgi:hypothetical protein
MPHVIVKLQSGRSEQQKTGIADESHQGRHSHRELCGGRGIGLHRGYRGERLDGEGLQAGYHRQFRPAL